MKDDLQLGLFTVKCHCSLMFYWPADQILASYIGGITLTRTFGSCGKGERRGWRVNEVNNMGGNPFQH